MQETRHGISFEIIELSTKLKQGTIGDFSRAIKVVNRLKDIMSVIFERATEPLEDRRLYNCISMQFQQWNWKYSRLYCLDIGLPWKLLPAVLACQLN